MFVVSCSTNDNIDSEIKEENNVVLEPKWSLTQPPYPKGVAGPYPLMNNPNYKSVSEITELKETDKVGIVSFNNSIKVYPYIYNNTFEIVNDNIGEYYYAFSYCPQTKSAINYNRVLKNDTLDLIASGYLYKENMVPSDTKFQYYWSQMLMKGINNAASEEEIGTYNHIQTNWKTVKEHFPEAKVFYSESTTTSKQSKTNQNKNSVDDKEDVFSIIENFDNGVKEEVVHAFPLQNFGNEVQMKKLSIDGNNVILISSKNHYFYTAYIVPEYITFKEIDPNIFPPILEDFQGNKWNVFGYALDGPNKGDQMVSPKSYIADWWAWKLFYENISIVQ